MKTEKDLLPAKRSIFLKALSALELSNHNLVVSLLMPLVAEEPEFLAGRKLLREAEINRARGKSIFSKFSGGGISLGKSKAQKLIEAGDWLGALAEAEKALENDPTSAAGNKDLFNAAESAAAKERENIKKLRSEHDAAADGEDKTAAARQLPSAEDRVRAFESIARFALETIALDQKNTKARHELGDYLMRIAEYDEAAKVFEEIISKTPSDLDARDKAKEAAARRSMKRGGIESSSFADMVKQRQAAGADEQVVTAIESVEDLARIVYDAHEAGNPDRETARKLADIYFNREEYESAAEYYRYLSSLANDTDPGLLRKISDCEMRRINRVIADKEKELESLSPLDEAAGVRRAELDELRRHRAEQMLGEARKRVERNPTDLQYRFELGEQLVLAGHYQEAIPELQKARSNPNTRTKALNMLGKCYTERNMLDMAAKTLNDAAAEIPGMDGTKKDILYNLGLVYERMGDVGKSLDCMKQIYEVDYGYLDVAARVEASYTA